MTRAEEAASRAYPVVWEKRPYDGIVRSTGDYEDINLTRRIGFQQGYEKAEEDLTNVAAFSSGLDGFYYGKGYQQGKKDAEKHLGWHSVEESLPPVDEEVIVLTDEMHGKKLPSACHISYGHRPNPDGWDGKSIFTGKVTHHDVITYDGWNIPGVKYWMPCPKIPNQDE